MSLDLDASEKAALVELLADIIERDRFPLSPRVKRLRGILAKLGFGPGRALPAAGAAGRAQHGAGKETAEIGGSTAAWAKQKLNNTTENNSCCSIRSAFIAEIPPQQRTTARHAASLKAEIGLKFMNSPLVTLAINWGGLMSRLLHYSPVSN